MTEYQKTGLFIRILGGLIKCIGKFRRRPLIYERGPEKFPRGTVVRIPSLQDLCSFKDRWKFHHNLTDEQMKFADHKTVVDEVSYYHGGDVLYRLKGIPGYWHEACLELVNTPVD